MKVELVSYASLLRWQENSAFGENHPFETLLSAHMAEKIFEKIDAPEAR